MTTETQAPDPAPAYRIETVGDMLKVPAERRSDMLREIEQALLFHEFSASLATDCGMDFPPLSGLDWTDDGDRSTHLQANGKPLLSMKVTKSAAAIPAPEGAHLSAADLAEEVERLKTQNRDVAWMIVNNDQEGAVQWAKGLTTSLDDEMEVRAQSPAEGDAELKDAAHAAIRVLEDTMLRSQTKDVETRRRAAWTKLNQALANLEAKPQPKWAATREAFEAWCVQNCYPTSKVANAHDEDGSPVYTDPRTHAAWFAVQDLATQAPAPAHELTDEQIARTLTKTLRGHGNSPLLVFADGEPTNVGRALAQAFRATQASAVAHALPPGLRRAAERTREDLGTNGTNYPDVRELLAFAEAAIQTATKPPVQDKQPQAETLTAEPFNAASPSPAP
ncbi:MAG TPA: hypothetical protein VGF12_07105 [Roseateles sp.]|uniref:hypothetical protein n=1 Tax=Roseateles sp. TaxID=1971397 RepID=UPI002ED98672